MAVPNALRAYLMTKLEDLKRGATVKGILPECPVTVVDVKWYGSASEQIVCQVQTAKEVSCCVHRSAQFGLPRGLSNRPGGDNKFLARDG